MTTVNSMSGYCVTFDPTVGVGSLGSNVPQTFVRADTWMNLDNNIRSKQDCNSEPIINVSSHVPQPGNMFHSQVTSILIGMLMRRGGVKLVLL